MAPKEKVGLECLLLTPGGVENQPAQDVVREVAKTVGFKFRSINGNNGVQEAASISDAISRADIIVADISSPTPNILYELGFAHANAKPVILLNQGTDNPPLLIPSALYVDYDNKRAGMKGLHRKLTAVLEQFRRSPRLFGAPGARSLLKPVPIPYIELGKLEPREFENLCFELLSQIGFRRVQWGKELPGVDAVATLKKKDPDGFDYQEVWLISMGLHAPIEMTLEMAMNPEYLSRRILAHPEFRHMNFSADTPLTILLISVSGGEQIELFERESRRIERRFRERNTSCRVRFWDAEHLVNLIRQYPQLAQKYFSEEGRAQSKYRKTPEDLYTENVQFAEQQQALIVALQEEKEKRTRAERDAVWKELSFTAAHKLGNPVFALETDLQALKKRILEPSAGDPIRVAEEMGASLEKAKMIIEQFKSLTKAQEITPQALSICHVVQAACRVAQENGIQLELKEAEQVPKVLADPGRMTECFDELVANSMHWFDKQEKKLTINVGVPKRKDLPELLDHARSYVHTFRRQWLRSTVRPQA